METDGQMNFVELKERVIFKFPAIVAKAVYNATAKFLETEQEIENFNVSLEQRRDEIVVHFIAKRRPGEKRLGGGFKAGISYVAAISDGTIVKEMGQR